METPRNELLHDAVAAARDRGIEQLEGAKGQLADGAERVAAAVERTAGALDGDGTADDAISGAGRSIASLMRQLAGGLREADVEQFASELAALARRNPAVFLAGSVALGFGVARFFKARAAGPAGQPWQSADRARDDDAQLGGREQSVSEETLDLSATGQSRDQDRGATKAAAGPVANDAAETARDERKPVKPRDAGKQKVKPQRASGDEEPAGNESTEDAQRGGSHERGV